MTNLISIITQLLLILLITGQQISAQKSVADSTQTFTQEIFFEFIKQYHPVARQSKLLTEQAIAQLLIAKGGFDPQVYAYLDQKSFDNKNYFTLSKNGLKVPTWYGVEVAAGYQLSNGDFLNPENKSPVEGQAFAGVSVSLLQGLIIDQRRATLKQAHIFAQYNEAERLNMLNNLLYEAANTYWTWALAYNNLLLQQQAVQLAELRLEWVTNTFLQGSRPALDTLEAMIQLQNRQFEQNEAELTYQNSALMVSNFLWFENDVPLEITPQLLPPLLNTLPLQIFDADSLSHTTSLLRQSHPELLKYQYKLSELSVERRLKSEKLKPKLNLNYNLLANGVNFFNPEKYGSNSMFWQNYKWGLELSMPLFLRSERGNLQLTKLKIKETNYQLQQKQLELYNKLNSSYNELLNNRRQIDLYTQTVNNYRILAEGEDTRFKYGESSLFLVNIRETKLIEAQNKLLELQAKHFKIMASIAFAAGVLHSK